MGMEALRWEEREREMSDGAWAFGFSSQELKTFGGLHKHEVQLTVQLDSS